jgi:2-polyprenyl-3-methyl-5-hydroxy-6-metoxy-1,4-benzoquinol methylase
MVLLSDVSPWVSPKPAAESKLDRRTVLAACCATLSLQDLFGVQVTDVGVGWGETGEWTFLADTLVFGADFPLVTIKCPKPQLHFPQEPFWVLDGATNGNLNTIGNNKLLWLGLCYNWMKQGGSEDVKNLLDLSTYETLQTAINQPDLLKKWGFQSLFALDTQITLREFVHRMLTVFRDAYEWKPRPPTPVIFTPTDPKIPTNSCVLKGKGCDDAEYDLQLLATLDEETTHIKVDECQNSAYKYPASVYSPGTQPEPRNIIVTDNAAAFYFAGLNLPDFSKNLTGLQAVMTKFWNVRRCAIYWAKICCWNSTCALAYRDWSRLYKPSMCPCENFSVQPSHPPTWSLTQFHWLLSQGTETTEDLYALIRKLVFMQKKNFNDAKIRQALQAPNDLEIFSRLRLHYKPTPSDNFNRGAFRVEEIQSTGVLALLPPSPEILDFGGGQGEIASELAKHFGIDKNNCFAIDVENWFGTKKIITDVDNVSFTFTRSNLLPYASGKFDFITCLQVLHHLENVDLTIWELHRCLRPGGILFVREHDAISPAVHTLIDIEHSLFEMVQKEPDFDYLQNYRARYFSKAELLQKMTKAGFQYLPNLQYGDPRGATRYYYAAFKKT